jgi:hypothetical protein
VHGLDSPIIVGDQAKGTQGWNYQPCDDESILQLGRAALPHLQRNHWSNWVAVIKALAVLRTQALNEAKTNRPQGTRYRAAIARRLRIYGFDALDKSDRCRLLKCADHLEDLEAWRSKQPVERQAGLNHPTVVLSAWKRSLRSPSPRPDPLNLAEQIARLSADQLLAMISHTTRAQLEDRLLAVMSNGASDKSSLAVTLTKQFRHGLSTDKLGERNAVFETIRRKIEANGRSIHDLVVAIVSTKKRRR